MNPIEHLNQQIKELWAFIEMAWLNIYAEALTFSTSARTRLKYFAKFYNAPRSIKLDEVDSNQIKCFVLE